MGHAIKMQRLRIIIPLLFLLWPQAARAQHALLIGGLGGTPENTEQIRANLFGAYTAFRDRFQFPADQIVVFAERALEAESFTAGISTAENIQAQFASLADRVTPDDHVFVLLFGHGSFNGQRAQFNIPRRDLHDGDYAEMVGSLGAGRIVFINTTSASAPFIEALSAPERIVITATRTPSQRNRTVFPQFLVEAMHGSTADLDKDGSLTVREVFYYAALKTAESFTASGHLATEHSLLEDTGDGQGYRLEELESAAEGNLAAITHFRRPTTLAGGQHGAGLLQGEKEKLEHSIVALKGRKESLAEDTYYAELEQLFVALARLNDRIEREDQ